MMNFKAPSGPSVRPTGAVFTAGSSNSVQCPFTDIPQAESHEFGFFGLCLPFPGNLFMLAQENFNEDEAWLL